MIATMSTNHRLLFIGITAYCGMVQASTQQLYPQGEQDCSILIRPNFTNIEWISQPPSEDTISDETDILRTNILNEANKYLGTRYMRGGKTPKGFDCSGFTGFIFKQFGYKLAASSQGQYHNGTEVQYEQIRPGDLLFFKGSSSRSIGHVAIAIASDSITGDISFIHAAIKGGIRIDRVSMPYYSSRYVGARRIIE